MQAVCLKENVPFVDLYDPTIYLMEDKNAPKITENGIRLNEYDTGRLPEHWLIPSPRPPSWWINLNAKPAKRKPVG